MKPEKVIVFDSGTLINFSMNGLLEVLRNLKKKFNGKFLITKNVEYEIIKRPSNINKYKLGALRLKSLIDEKVIEFPSVLGISEKQVNDRIKKYLDVANNAFYRGERAIHLVDGGEAACLALSSILSEKGIKNVISIDERTTRMIVEKPDNLKKLLERKLHTSIHVKPIGNLFSGFVFIRSSELVYVAYKKGVIKKDKNLLDAMLYAVKFRGCAISEEEIKEVEKYL